MDFPELRKKIIEKDFAGMNPPQFEAVTTVNGPLLVLAGAGSGKTTVLVNRIANLIKYGNAYNSDYIPRYTDEDISAAECFLNGENTELPYTFSVNAPRPWEILAITFTNKAAGELKERIARVCGDAANDIWAGTFHSVCGKILRRNAEAIGFSSHFTIYDTDDQKRLIKEILKSRGADDKMFPPRSVLSAISSAKDSLLTPKEYEHTAGNDIRRQQIAVFYKEYQKRLKESDAMDFDDMIVKTVELFKENPDVLEHYGSRFKYIMVDEYQDTNHAQYMLIKLLASVHGNICVVGDDDQSIYRFRGATIENILSFEEEYDDAKTIRLEQNYRSTGNILNAANAVISNNLGRKGKNLWTDSGEGEAIILNTLESEREEARFVTDVILENVRNGAHFSDHAVLYRMNAQSAAIEQVFARSGVSYKIIGGFRFFERKEIRDVLAYLHIINNKNDDLRLKRIINEPKRGIGNTTVENASGIAAQLGLSLFEVFSRADEFASLSRAAAKLKEFCKVINDLSELLEDDISLCELTEEMLERSGYTNALICDTSPEAADRLDNVKEFVSTVKQYELENDVPTLSAFLEEIALVSDTDSLDENDDKVVLMTIHSAKGLEFERVFLVGMEEGIFPGNQSIYGGPEEIEEERRLAYVAITRAKRHLNITNTSSRLLYGSTTRNLPSRFLKEIPQEYCTVIMPKPVRSFVPDSSPRYNVSKSVESYSPYRKQNASPFAAASPVKNEPAAVCPVGSTVEHKTFGIGVVLSSKPMGNDTLLEIAFENAGTKKLMSNYAKLKIL